MKKCSGLFIALVLLLIETSSLFSQTKINFQGSVKDSLDNPLKRATIFLNGTTVSTMTDDNGQFYISNLTQGNYDVVVTMIGYKTFHGAVTIYDKPITSSIILKEKPYLLKEIKIGPDRAKQNLKIFKKTFIGQSAMAKKCRILNPEVIDFGQKGKTLTASSTNFILIENPVLGYKLRYLLRSFQYNMEADIAQYDGQVVFEEMQGTAKMKDQWRKSRKAVYAGSLMHFLRSVYWNSVAKEGFSARQYFKNVVESSYDDPMDLASVAKTTLKFDTLVSVVDTALVSFKFSNLYLEHGAKKTIKKNNVVSSEKMTVPFGRKASILRLVVSEALIDSRGSYRDPQTFYIYGFLARKRVGDQLPFEYQP